MSSYYEVEFKVKKTKPQGYKVQFESLNIHDDEDIENNFLRVDEVVNTIRGLDEKVDEDVVVQKLLRSLLASFNSKVLSIE